MRTRDNQRRGEHSLADVLRILEEERSTRSLVSIFPSAAPADASAAKAAASSPNAAPAVADAAAPKADAP